MQGEILIIPTDPTLEMLKKSAQILAKHLVKSGIKLNDQISICPDRNRLQHAVSKALGRSEIVFTIGGMGKDSGFVAKQVISEGLSLPLQNSSEVLMAIKSFSTRTGIPLSADDVTLASLPAGSKPLIPVSGIIPGCVVSSSSQHIVMLPENMEELGPMISKQVLPILSRVGVRAESEHFIKTYGATEEQIRKLIMDYMGAANPIVTTNVTAGEVIVKVVAHGSTTSEAAQISTPVLRSIVNRLGDYAYGLDVENLETALIQKISRKSLTLAVAESGTSGRFYKRIKPADNNNFVVGSIICDDLDLKAVEFGIKKRLLKKEGNVSEFSSVVLANGAREKFGSGIGVGITTNISDRKKHEDVIAYIAVCDNKYVYIKKIYIDGDSTSNSGAVIDAAVAATLNMTRLYVDYLPQHYPHSIPVDKALNRKVSVTDKDSYQTTSFEEQEQPEFYYEDADEFYEDVKPKKSTGKKIRSFVLLVAILAIVGSIGYFAFYAVQSVAARAMREDLAAVYESLGINGLRLLNDDTVAYVGIEGTILQYPVVQSDNNKYYLRLDFNEKYNDNGIPFMDYRSDVKKPSDNLIVYGHNMRDGQIFGELLNYKDLDYYKEHSTIDFETSQQEGTYKIFAVYITSANASHFADGTVYDYTSFIDAETDEEFNQYVNEARIRSRLHLPVDVVPGDEILTLSTCDYDFFDSRYVVLARRVRDNESTDVDTDLAEYNPTPLYPDVWYEMYGGRKPDTNNWEFPLASTMPAPATGGGIGDKPEDEPLIVSNFEVAEQPVVPPAEAPIEQVSTQPEETAPVADTTKEDEQKKVEEEAKAKAEAEAQAKAAKEKAEQEAAAKAELEKKSAEEAQEKITASEKAIYTQLENANAAYNKIQISKQQVLLATIKPDAKDYLDSTGEHKSDITKSLETAKPLLEASNTANAKDYYSQIEAYITKADASIADMEKHYTALPEKIVETPVATTTDTTGTDTTTTGGNYDTSSGLKVSSSVNYDPNSDLDIISRIVQQEVGSSFHVEAIKAQAVAAYSYIKNRNSIGLSPSVYMATSVDPKVKNAVADVLGECVLYGGRPAYATYHAINAGYTSGAIYAWGGSYDYDYLQPVDSAVDEGAKGYKVTKKMTSSEVASRLSSVLGIEATGDPSQWFQVLDTHAGVYNGNMSVCGYTQSQKKGSKITGPLLREYVLNLRSAAFDIDYDSGLDTFTFTTYGYGHGVGMSQKGANEYAKQGWSYRDILTHYYPGTSVG